MAAAAAPAEAGGGEPCPWMEVDLDASPRERWRGVAERFRLRERIPAMARALWEQYEDAGEPESEAFLAALAEGVMAGLAARGCGDYAEEMRAMAGLAGVSVEEVVLLHLSYEAEAGCTAVVGRLPGGRACLGRTLDWHLPALRELTVNLRFVRGGRVVYTAASWAGYVGVLTAQRPGACAVAVNFREPPPGPDDGAAYPTDPQADDGFAWPVGFLVRHAVESASGASYASCLETLAGATLMSPCYLILADGASCAGALLTRDEVGDCRRVELAAAGDAAAADEPPQQQQGGGVLGRLLGRGKRRKKQAGEPKREEEKGRGGRRQGGAERHALVVQANMDWWERSKKKDTQESLPRVALARRMLPRTGDVTRQGVWDLLYANPVWDDETIYATLMVPSTGEFATAVRPPARAAGAKGSRKKQKKKRSRR